MGGSERRSQQAKRMDVRTSTWSSMKWERALALKGCALEALVSVQIRFSLGTPNLLKRPEGPHK